MAELLIPVVALAGAAVLSSMDKKKELNINRENYKNINNKINENFQNINNSSNIDSTNNINTSQNAVLNNSERTTYTDKYVQSQDRLLPQVNISSTESVKSVMTAPRAVTKPTGLIISPFLNPKPGVAILNCETVNMVEPIPVVELAPTSTVIFRPWPVSVVAPIHQSCWHQHQRL